MDIGEDLDNAGVQERPLKNDFVQPEPIKLAKLKGEIAQAAGLVASWTLIHKAEPVDTPNGSHPEELYFNKSTIKGFYAQSASGPKTHCSG
ncbi:hypothetical protein PG995_006433 [Apiospora arundinis]